MTKPARKGRTSKPGRAIRDLGEGITEAPYRPRAVRSDPETELGKLFAAIGADYGGAIRGSQTAQRDHA